MAIGWDNLLLFQAAVTLMMTGVIWSVQLVIYPLFTHYKGNELETLHRYYTPKISYVVFPLMFGELGLGLLSLFLYPTSTQVLLFLPIIGVWGLTFFISVPLHQQIADSQDPMAAKKLVLTNWYRTILWSIRSLLLILLISKG